MKFSILEIKELRMAISCQSKNDPRLALNGVCFDFSKFENMDDELIEGVPLVGTNGHIVVNSPVDIFNYDDLPFGKDLVLLIDGTIPKTAYSGEFHINGMSGILTLYKKGAGKPMKVIPLTVLNSSFPDYRRVMKRWGSVRVDTITFNPVYVADLVKASGVNEFSGVTMTFGNSDMNDAIIIEIKGFPKTEIIMMPIRNN